MLFSLLLPDAIIPLSDWSLASSDWCDWLRFQIATPSRLSLTPPNPTVRPLTGPVSREPPTPSAHPETSVWPWVPVAVMRFFFFFLKPLSRRERKLLRSANTRVQWGDRKTRGSAHSLLKARLVWFLYKDELLLLDGETFHVFMSSQSSGAGFVWWCHAACGWRQRRHDLTDLRTVTNIDLVAISDGNHTFGPEVHRCQRSLLPLRTRYS